MLNSAPETVSPGRKSVFAIELTELLEMPLHKTPPEGRGKEMKTLTRISGEVGALDTEENPRSACPASSKPGLVHVVRR